MAFDYNKLDSIRTQMDTVDLNNLNKLFKDFTGLIDSQVNNDKVWYGKSSSDFKRRWDNFESTEFPVYRQNFNKEIENVIGTAKSFRESEGI